MRCPSCSTDLPASSRFCLSCGAATAPAGANGDATVAMEIPSSAVSSPSRSRGSAPSEIDHQRFPPGTLIAGRYRVVSRLGKGGMGEVFRAEDIILGQPVALKFLPETATSNVALLTRFYDEVRIARQVTHPNVCRVYDIGEVQGQPFLSMQYIDGEDLGSLLRRIGHLPTEKATEFARKLCAGLAAAHAQGVLHRDLKPANVMIDSKGQVLITDFGLAGFADQLAGAEVRNGTPAYMAPEQLTGKEVSVQSDLYALGLVLYEMFTGRPPFEADSLEAMIRARETSSLQSPSTLVRDLDPAVERAILRCLQPDPRLRPPSALAVASALPGGDPLAAALAAGETPTPEVVAAAGDNDALRLAPAIAALAGVALALAAYLIVIPLVRQAAKIPLENPPEVLTAKARDIVRQLGYAEHPADHAGAYEFLDGYTDYMQTKIRGLSEWDSVLAKRPSNIIFRYRQSPRYLEAQTDTHSGAVTDADPPSTISGMVSLKLDMDGRLLGFRAIPPQLDTSAAPVPPADWSALFQAAGLDPAKFQPASPQWTPLAAIDARAAWTGVMPGGLALPVRIEAAAWHGKPVYFEIVWPWTKPHRMQADDPSYAQRVSNILGNVVLVAVLLAAIVMARQNLRAKRGDANGAIRLGLLVFSLRMLMWVCFAHHVPTSGELSLFGQGVADSLTAGAIMWGIYLAVEPWVRRRWPQTMITWSRVLGGKFYDPLVGRDLLFGILFGLLYCLLIAALEFTSIHLGEAPSGDYSLDNLLGARSVVGLILGHLYYTLTSAPGFFFMIFLLRVVLRKQWLAASAFVLFWTVAKALPTDHPYLYGMFYMLVYGIIVVILMRFGLFALAVTIYFIDTTNQELLTTDVFSWYGFSSLLMLALIAGFAYLGFRMALGKRKLMDESLLQT